ncbi:MAG: DUF2480 family protein [Chitinophagales bacterium]
MEVVNKVAQSGLVTIDLEEYFPEREIAVFDLKDYLFKGLILREKDFREALAAHDWDQYTGKYLAVCCTADAIIPNWAWMLVTVHANAKAQSVHFGTAEEVLAQLYDRIIDTIDVEQYRDKRVVIKGCSDKPVPVEAYLEITRKLEPLAKSIMYGEPCSTVPVFKRK